MRSRSLDLRPNPFLAGLGDQRIEGVPLPTEELAAPMTIQHAVPSETGARRLACRVGTA